MLEESNDCQIFFSFFRDHPRLMPWTGVLLFSFRTWHWLNWGTCKITVYSIQNHCVQHSPKCFWGLKGFSAHFFSPKGQNKFCISSGFNFRQCSWNLQRCSGEMAGNIPVTARGSTLPEISLPQHRRFVQTMQNAIWNMETSNIFAQWPR